MWMFRYFPSQDGPSHVENADIIRRYSNPSSELRRYYLLATDRELNWLGHLMLAGLRFALPPAPAISLFLSGYVILFPLSVVYALRSVRPRAGPWALLAFPFIYNYPLHMGFFNFAWSIPFFFLLVGWFLRPGRSARSYGVFAAISLVLYLFHPGTWTMAALAIGILAACRTVGDWMGAAKTKSLAPAEAARIAVRGLVLPFLALLPALLLFLRFASRAGGASAMRLKLQAPVNLYAAALLNEFSFRNTLEHRLFQLVLAALILSAAALLLLKIAKRSFSELDSILLVAAAFLALGFLTPDEMLSGQFLRPRLVLFVCLTLILWLGSAIRSRGAALAVMGLGSIASAGLLGTRMTAYRRLDSFVTEYVSAGSAVEPNRTILPLNFLSLGPELPGHGRLPMTVHVFQHTSGYIASERNVVDLANYEANTDDFPVRYRPGMNPYERLGDVENNQARIDRVNLSGYAGTGGSVDYVLLWGARVGPEGGNHTNAAPILRQLEEGYDRVFISRPLGLAEVYRRKGLGARPAL